MKKIKRFIILKLILLSKKILRKYSPSCGRDQIEMTIRLTPCEVRLSREYILEKAKKEIAEQICEVVKKRYLAFYIDNYYSDMITGMLTVVPPDELPDKTRLR